MDFERTGVIESTEHLRHEYSARAAQRSLAVQVPMEGSLYSEIVIIGEYAGADEVTAGRPFVGGSGRFLFDNLRNVAGINRNQCYVTNLAKRLVVDGKMDEVERQAWRDMLDFELSQLKNVKYILALGGEVLHYLFKETKITNYRGSVFDYKLGDRIVKVLTTFNPAYPLGRAKNMRMPFVSDIRRFQTVVEGKFVPYEITAIINPTKAESIEYIDGLEGSGRPISYDIETNGKHTVCVGLANSGTEGICINFRTFNDNHYTLEEEYEIRMRLQRLFNNPETRMIAQNGGFDQAWLWYHDRINSRRNWFDTLLAHHLLYPSFPHDLGFLCTQYTTHPYYKDEKDAWKETGDIDRYWTYNVKDAAITYAVHMAEREELRRRNLENLFFDHVMRAQKELVRMTVLGVKADLGKRGAFYDEYSRDIYQLELALHNKIASVVPGYTGDYNFNSNADLGRLFFEDLRLIGRGTSTDKDNRERMINNPKTPDYAIDILNDIDDFKEKKKFLGTYIESEIDIDGYIRCDYKQYGVTRAPGRLSSAKTLWNTGMNLQNQPKKGFEVFIAPDGMVVWYFDLAQAEARIVAWLAGITKWQEQFERARLQGGYDAHIALASDLFKVPYDQIPTVDHTEDGKPTLRYIAKRCRHGLNYRMMAPRLAQTAKLAMSVARHAFHVYHRETPELKRWWEEETENVRREKKLVNPFGREWVLLQPMDDDVMDSIVAFKPQSTIGDKVVQCIYQIMEDPRLPEGARVTMNVHDALYGICWPDDVKTVLTIAKEHAEAPIYVKGHPVIIPADCKVALPKDGQPARYSELEKFKL